MHKHHNGLKTAALFGGIFAVLLGPRLRHRQGRYLWLFALFGVGMTAYGYWNSDKLAIRAMHAYPVSEAQAPAMYRIVRELSTAASQPMPRLYISPTEAPNAFATGRNPAQRRGLLHRGHPRPARRARAARRARPRADARLQPRHPHRARSRPRSPASSPRSAQMLMFTSMFGGGGSDEDRPNPIALLAMSLLAPFAAMIIQMAISRTREYDADEDGADAHRRPARPRLGAAQARVRRRPRPARRRSATSSTPAT